MDGLIAHVPHSQIELFKGLGAVKAGLSTIPQYDRACDTWNLRPRTPVSCLVYFFDAKGREIGYWSDIQRYFGNTPTIFAPNYRHWAKEFLDNLVWAKL